MHDDSSIAYIAIKMYGRCYIIINILGSVIEESYFIYNMVRNVQNTGRGGGKYYSSLPLLPSCFSRTLRGLSV